MHRTLRISVAVVAAAALTLGLSAGAAGASVPSATKVLCAGKTKKKAIKQIKTAFTYFLDGSKGYTPQQKEPYIETMDTDAAFRAQFEDSAAKNSAAAATTSVDVDKVKCIAKGKKADVTFTLVLNGNRAEGLAPPGQALWTAGKWKVSKQTVCDLQALGDPTVLESGPCAL